MADNVLITPGLGATVAADDIGAGVLAQRVKVVLGGDGTGVDAASGSGVNGPTVLRASLATDDAMPVAVGAQADAAAAADNSNASLIALIKRNNQRLTSLIGLLPTAIGNTTKAASLGVALASDDLLVTAFGAQADAAAAADNSTASLVALLKRNNQRLTQIDTDITASNAQLPTTIGPTTKSASLSVTGATDDPAALGIGGTADAAATAGSTGSISAKLRTLTGQLPPTSGGSVQITITRPANTTAYSAGDVIGAAAAALTFATGMASGQRVMIAGIDLEYDVAAIPAGMTTCRLHLYSVTPPSALADNAAWDLPSGDRASYLGYVDIPQILDMGSTLFIQSDNVNKAIQLSGSASVFAYLMTTVGFTPGAVSEVLKVRLQFLGL